MNVLILSDLHLVSPDDPNQEWQRRRAHFVEGRRSLPALRKAIARESPDYLICLGDLVDWYSDENRDYALEFLHSLRIPWSMTPGNHDASSPGPDSVSIGLQGWTESGVHVDNRMIMLDSLHAFLVNSFDSGVPHGTGDWLRETLTPGVSSAVFTHVPPDTKETRTAILERDPGRNLTKYVQSGAPELFEYALSGRVHGVWCGHLHFPACVMLEGTHIHILPLSVHAHGKHYPGQGSFQVLDTGTLETRRISYAGEY